MADLPRFPEQPPGRGFHQFQLETAFLDRLAELVTSAPLRFRFLDGLRHRLDQALIEHRRNPDTRGVWVDGGEGFLLTEPGFAGVPGCMITFAFDPLSSGSRVVVIWSIRTLPPRDPVEDGS